jgi:hypothetical protein
VEPSVLQNPKSYQQALQAAMEQETKLAGQYKAKGDKVAALECLRRVKLMKEEGERVGAILKQKQQEEEAAAAMKKKQEVEDAARQQVAQATVPVPAAGATGSPAAGAQRLDNFRSVDLIVSVGVIDWELSLIKNLDNEEEAMRKTDLEIKKQMMLMGIEMGTLTMESYAATLNERILLDKQLAKSLNEKGDKKDALYVMKRAKIMENELNS